MSEVLGTNPREFPREARREDFNIERDIGLQVLRAYNYMFGLIHFMSVSAR